MTGSHAALPGRRLEYDSSGIRLPRQRTEKDDAINPIYSAKRRKGGRNPDKVIQLDESFLSSWASKHFFHFGKLVFDLCEHNKNELWK
jgi:hypothetical protein